MNKKGQITLFIVLGIVILLVFLFVYFLESGYISKTKNFAKSFGLISDKDAVKNFVDSCMEETGKNALTLVGLQGGYVLPKNYAEIENIRVNYGYYEKKNVLVTKEALEEEIKKYFELFMPACVDDLKNYNLVKENMTVNASVSEMLVSMNARYPISIVKGDSKIVVDPKYAVRYRIRLGKMIDIADDIVRKTFGREDIIDMAYLYSIGNEFNVQISDEAGIRIYMITDKSYKLDMINYTFMFAEKF